MNIFHLANEMKEAKNAINANPMAETRSNQQLAKIDDLESKIRYLLNRNVLIEALLAQLMQVAPEQLKAALDAQMPALSRTKTVDELRQESVPCPSCRRPVHRSLGSCQICGAEIRASIRSGGGA